MNIPCFLRTTQIALTPYRNLNCWTAAIAKKHRKVYPHEYLTYLVLPNGSTIRINYPVPRQIIRLPLDINNVSEEEHQMVLEKRKIYKKVVIKEEYQDEFDETQFYIK